MAVLCLWLGWMVRKDSMQGRMREMESALLKRVAGLWTGSCRPILLAHRGLGIRDLLPVLVDTAMAKAAHCHAGERSGI